MNCLGNDLSASHSTLKENQECVLAVYEAQDQAELVFQMSSCRIYRVDISMHLNLFVS